MISKSQEYEPGTRLFKLWVVKDVEADSPEHRMLAAVIPVPASELNEHEICDSGELVNSTELPVLPPKS